MAVMEQPYCMDIIMHWNMEQITYSRQILTDRHFRRKQKESYDMVIGWRNKRQDGGNRVFVTRTLRLVIRVCFGVSVTDANTPFRLMKASTLQKYIGLIPKDFNLSNVILSVIYAKKGCKVKYIPITFRPRQGGVNSINMKKIFGFGRQAVRDFRKINKVLSRRV